MWLGVFKVYFSRLTLCLDDGEVIELSSLEGVVESAEVDLLLVDHDQHLPSSTVDGDSTVQ